MATSLSNDRLSTSGNLTKGGNGRYNPLRKRSAGNRTNAGAYDPFAPTYDRMRFKNSRDPIFVAFDHIEKQSPLKLTTDLIKEGITDSISTIGKTLVKLFN